MNKEPKINLYGDLFAQAVEGHGIDIASQRADDLDVMAMEFVRELSVEKEVLALDAPCGMGGQAIRLAGLGAMVFGLDSADLGAAVQAKAREAHVEKRLSFCQGDLRDLDHLFPRQMFDLICCQRAIHYVSFDDAVIVTRQFASLLKPGGKLFLSASGLYSELGDGYPHLERQKRYVPLSQMMSEKHGIKGNVCLYTEKDLLELFRQAGMTVETVFTSAFGNVKGIASKSL